MRVLHVALTGELDGRSEDRIRGSKPRHHAKKCETRTWTVVDNPWAAKRLLPTLGIKSPDTLHRIFLQKEVRIISGIQVRLRRLEAEEGQQGTVPQCKSNERNVATWGRRF